MEELLELLPELLASPLAHVIDRASLAAGACGRGPHVGQGTGEPPSEERMRAMAAGSGRAAAAPRRAWAGQEAARRRCTEGGAARRTRGAVADAMRCVVFLASRDYQMARGQPRLGTARGWPRGDSTLNG